MVSHPPVELEQLRLDVLPAPTKEAFQRFIKLKFLEGKDWYLAGETALALQAGHRESVDLDFFSTQSSFDISKLEARLAEAGNWRTTSTSEGTVYGEFLGAKVSFIGYPSFKPADPMLQVGSVQILAPADIGAMKIIAVSQRGRKRDFFDLYWLCRNLMPLTDILARSERQYAVRQNVNHILKSLVYFEDGENDPEPVIHFSATWDQVKEFFRNEVARITLHVIGLS
jgi:hypothetical protein